MRESHLGCNAKKNIVVKQYVLWETYRVEINRGYYMAARGYEFYLRVLKVSLTSERSERVLVNEKIANEKIVLIFSVRKSQNSNKEEKNSITLPSSHLEAIL